MKYTKLLFVGVLASLALPACDESEEFTSQNEMVTDIIVTGEDIVPELGVATRTSYTMESSLKFSWSTGDTLGIYPIGGTQVDFPISTGEGSKSAAFDGGAWALRSTYTYAAYYPFTAKNFHIKENAIPVDYSGQEQNGNGSLAHLGKYDFMAAAATSPSAAGGVNLAMKHLGSFVRLQLTMPVADTYKSVTLSCEGEKFTTTATYDLTAATPVLTPKSKSSSYTIKLKNTSTTEKNELLTVYAFVGPTDLSGNQLTITVAGTANQTYIGKVDGKNMQARGGYNYALEFKNGTNASGDDISFDDDPYNGHEYVDLGLPSGLKWATCNVGATNPEDYGDFFAWGDTEPYYAKGHALDRPCSSWKTGKSGYDWESYKWCNGSMVTMTKYNSDPGYGTVDNKTALDPEDDAARQNWGGSWRMPTLNEFYELHINCIWTWTIHNTIYGYKVTGTNDNWIFLPAAGFRYDKYLSNFGSYGYYWSSKRGFVPPCHGENLYFDSSNGIIPNDFEDRCRGLCVRPVTE